MAKLLWVLAIDLAAKKHHDNWDSLGLISEKEVLFPAFINARDDDNVDRARPFCNSRNLLVNLIFR